jgi:hypothetical protein
MKLVATAVVLLIGAGLGSLVGTASGSTAIGRQSGALDRACGATETAVLRALTRAVNAQVRTISSDLLVVIPGTVTGAIAFNPSGSRIAVGAPPTRGSSFGCGEATARHGRGAGRSHVVATLRDKFTRSGRRVLTFTLNDTGRRILTRLGAQERAYLQEHRRGQPPPTIGFGIALSYAPAR